jgi:hypothetical protein
LTEGRFRIEGVKVISLKPYFLPDIHPKWPGHHHNKTRSRSSGFCLFRQLNSASPTLNQKSICHLAPA